MKIEVKNYKDVELFSRLFEESHIKRIGDKVYLVVDKINREKLHS
ncbi:MAG: hypothetical protein QXN16_00545 [Candidatus Micrarchaeaceae archaeon]